MQSVKMFQNGFDHLDGAAEIQIADIGTHQITGRASIDGQFSRIGGVGCTVQRFFPVELCRAALRHEIVGKALPVIALSLGYDTSLTQTVGQMEQTAVIPLS